MRSPVKRLTPLAAAALLALGSVAPLAAQGRAPLKPGGLALLLEVRAEGAQAAAAVAQTAEVIRRRCARLGVRCELSPRAGGVANRLALRFSTAKDVGRVRGVLLSKGFELRAVVSLPNPFPASEYATRADAESVAPAGADVLPLKGYGGAAQTYVVTERAPVITGADLRSPSVTRAPSDDPGGGYALDCLLRPPGAARFRRWTRARINSYVAVVYDGVAVSTPYIRAPIHYNVVISGGFDRRQAEDAAAALWGGHLPAPVAVLEESPYEP